MTTPIRLLPKDFPPFTTVQGYFYQWRDDGRWQAINHHLVMQAREAAGGYVGDKLAEALISTAATWVLIASVTLIMRRLARG